MLWKPQKEGDFHSGCKDGALLVFCVMSVPLDVFKAMQTFALRHVTELVTRKVEGLAAVPQKTAFPVALGAEPSALLLQDCTLVHIPQLIRPCPGICSSAGQESRPVLQKRTSGSPAITLSHSLIQQISKYSMFVSTGLDPGDTG